MKNMKNTVIIDGQEIDREDAPIEYDYERFNYYFGKSSEMKDTESEESEKNSSNIKAVNHAFQSINNLFNF